MEHHSLITEKFNLLISMTKFCDNHKENVFDMMPVTFFVELADLNKEIAYNSSLQPFMQYFQTLEENRTAVNNVKNQLEEQ